MEELVQQTREFHTKQGFTEDADLIKQQRNPDIEDLLFSVADEMAIQARRFERLMNWRGDDDIRLRRAQILIEELSETIEAMAHCDEVAFLDGLSDLMFVTIGTAISFGLPITEGLTEVCKSNLTKRPRKDGDIRLRDKGPDYVPPDMMGIIAIHRSQQ
jgi:NTP pyrophosphatase (non-canonical NTP hydrolase)